MKCGADLAIVVVAICLAGCSGSPSNVSENIPQDATYRYTVQTQHYEIVSSATPKLTEQTGQAVEQLFVAYKQAIGFGGAPLPNRKLRLRLYADRAEFKAHNKTRSWAEGYYHEGVCYAYVDINSPSPHHWMLHEAVHQINSEITGFATKQRWLSEGLASYMGSSQLLNDRLMVGVPDKHAYPIWWLDKRPLSGNWKEDLASHRVISLQALITDQGGPPFDQHFNAYYLGYWSLTHFLLHHDQGKYASGYRQMLRSGGTLEDFERRIGPIEKIQSQWYAYLLEQSKKGAAQSSRSVQ